MRMELRRPVSRQAAELVTTEALSFVTRLHRDYNPWRELLLKERGSLQAAFDAGTLPDLLPATRDLRERDWQVGPVPEHLRTRRLFDLEDGLSPSWQNVLSAQVRLARRVREFATPAVVVRPRGWHLAEKHVLCDGLPVSASLFDAGLYLFHSARSLLNAGSGPCLCLPKLESPLEARLWHDVLTTAEDWLGLPGGSVRVIARIETLPASLAMEEILFELRARAIALEAGHRGFLFSLIQKFRHQSAFVLPDRDRIAMRAPFLHAFSELLARTCDRRGALPIGVTATLHTPIAARDLLQVQFARTLVTETGLRENIGFALRYLDSWLNGAGTMRVGNRTEDGATAELARALVWQWVRHGVRVEERGPRITPALVRLLAAEESGRLQARRPADVQALFEQITLGEEFVDFFTLPGYEYLA